MLDCKLLYYTRRVVRVVMTRTTRFFIDRKASAVDIKRGCRFLGRCLCKRKPRRGDRIQAGVKPLLNRRKKEKPRRGDGTAAYPLSFRHSSGVLMGDAFIQGLRYRLPLPVVHRSFGAYNPNNLIPNSRINYLITYNRVVRVVMTRTTRFVLWSA